VVKVFPITHIYSKKKRTLTGPLQLRKERRQNGPYLFLGHHFVAAVAGSG